MPLSMYCWKVLPFLNRSMVMTDAWACAMQPPPWEIGKASIRGWGMPLQPRASSLVYGRELAVVEQPRLPEPHHQRHHRRPAKAAINLLQRLVVRHADILHAARAQLAELLLDHLTKADGLSLAGGKRVARCAQRRRERGSLPALLGRQVDVPAAHRKAVSLPHNGARD